MTFLTFAMAPATDGGTGGMGIGAFLPMALVFVIFYFLILRPQSKRQKEHEKVLNSLTKGDLVVTTGGIHGTVQRVNEKEQTIIIKIADDVKIEIDRVGIARKLSSESE